MSTLIAVIIAASVAGFSLFFGTIVAFLRRRRRRKVVESCSVDSWLGPEDSWLGPAFRCSIDSDVSFASTVAQSINCRSFSPDGFFNSEAEGSRSLMPATSLTSDAEGNPDMKKLPLQPTSTCHKKSVSWFSEGIPLLPPEKNYHYFLSFEKRHTTKGEVSELTARHLHELFKSSGFKGIWHFEKEEEEVSPEFLELAIQSSCTMIVVLSDETVQSALCQLEWVYAKESGIPVACVVDVAIFSHTAILEQVQRSSSHLTSFPWFEYTERTHNQVADSVQSWISEQCGKKPVRCEIVVEGSDSQHDCVFPVPSTTEVKLILQVPSEYGRPSCRRFAVKGTASSPREGTAEASRPLESRNSAASTQHASKASKGTSSSVESLVIPSWEPSHWTGSAPVLESAVLGQQIDCGCGVNCCLRRV